MKARPLLLNFLKAVKPMKTVLVIEDNSDIRENIVEILGINTYAVICADNGRKGLDMAINQSPDVIVCDLMMPELNGYEVLEHLKNDSRTSGIPFIFLTASVERMAVETGINLGAEAYLRKPFESEELLKAVADALNGI
jgi:CheY-like chemotaxis protein